jgi:hypothetical protein
MIAHARCQQHPGREAVAKCPSCKQSFCRECITEHDGRMLCVLCLTKRTQLAKPPSPAWGRVGWGLGAVAGLLLAWLFFLGVGELIWRASA